MSGRIHRPSRTRDNSVGGLDRFHSLYLPGATYLDAEDFSGIIKSKR